MGLSDPLSTAEDALGPEQQDDDEHDERRQAHGVAEDARPFLGSNFQATLRDLETRMREAAGNLEFETAARLRDEIKRLKMMDLEFANDLMTAPGEAVDKAAPMRERKAARAEAQERFRKGKL